MAASKATLMPAPNELGEPDDELSWSPLRWPSGIYIISAFC